MPPTTQLYNSETRARGDNLPERSPRAGACTPRSRQTEQCPIPNTPSRSRARRSQPHLHVNRRTEFTLQQRGGKPVHATGMCRAARCRASGLFLTVARLSFKIRYARGIRTPRQKDPMLRFQTAGESHGQALVALLSGLPAGLRIDFNFVNREMKRRQGGYGRGGRMKLETDTPQFLSGVRHGQTVGSPVTILIENLDWANWKEAMAVEDRPETRGKHRPLSPPRPGHADLAGCLKFNFRDARYVLERASARETAARVAAGAVAKIFLGALEVEVASHTLAVGGATLNREAVPFEEILALRDKDEVVLNCVDAAAESRMKEEVDRAIEARDTVGRTIEVIAHGVPPGLGSCAQNPRDRKSTRLNSSHDQISYAV